MVATSARRHPDAMPTCHLHAVPDRHPAAVAATLRRLKSAAGSHSPSVGEVERALPGLIEIDACFLSNPYATDELLARMRAIPPATLERIVSHYPSQNAGIAASLAHYVGVDADSLYVANGAHSVSP